MLPARQLRVSLRRAVARGNPTLSLPLTLPLPLALARASFSSLSSASKTPSSQLSRQRPQTPFHMLSLSGLPPTPCRLYRSDSSKPNQKPSQQAKKKPAPKKKAKPKTFYEQLNVAKDASQDKIRKSYLELARKHHPDSKVEGGDPSLFADIASAYKVLKDSDSRQRYDSRLEQGNDGDDDMDWGDASSYVDSDMSNAKVLYSQAILMFGDGAMPLFHPLVARLFIHLGVPQVEENNQPRFPSYKRQAPWVIVAILTLFFLKGTYTSWESGQVQESLTEEEVATRRGRACKLVACAAAVGFVVLKRKKWDIYSADAERVKERFQSLIKGKIENDSLNDLRNLDAVIRLLPRVTFVMVGGTIIGSYAVAPLSWTLPDTTWHDPRWQSVQWNASKVMQGLGAVSLICYQLLRRRAVGVMDVGGWSLVLTALTGRFIGWMFSFVLTGFSDRRPEEAGQVVVSEEKEGDVVGDVVSAFCHKCGAKYKASESKFCSSCGVARV